ncbi:uncharacterized protein LOC118514326 [Anopheles stephensi]|uniref:uncharacterized protein LOC118514326 n=1 Tax=Anopheles stephensi TaxID=30069 RepID=UPI001658A504|nr:uncharacterized protein LOC118514326 [Anopheles stephensi]
MYHLTKALQLVGALLLCLQSVPKALAEECVELKDHAWKIATCCKQELFLDSGMLSSCFKTTDAEFPDNNLESVVCAFDCIYRDMGFLEQEYDINAEKLNACQAAHDDAYKETFANAVDHCLAIKEVMAQEAETVSTACSSFAVKFHACIATHVMKNCPAERWDGGRLCDRVKNGAPICDEKMYPATMFATLFVLTTITAYTTSTECISKRQQTELKFCCEMEELIPRHIRTKCQEKAAADHNPGFRMYHVCQSQCLYEEMDAIDGYEVHLERLYPVTEHFPVDYRQAVRLAIDECNKLIQGAMKDKKVKREGADCPMLGSQVEMCLKAATYKNCPNSRWTASVACSKVRQGVPFC